MSLRGEIALVLLFVTLVTVAVVAGRRGAGPPPTLDRRASTLRSGAEGSKAVYEVLAQLGRPVERRRTPLFTLSRAEPAPGVLVVAAPPIPLEPAELSEVVRYVARGGAVFAAGRGGGITACFGWSEGLPAAGAHSDSGAVVGPGDLALPPARRVLRPIDAKALAARSGSACGDLPAAGRGGAVDTLLRTAGGEPLMVRLAFAGGGLVTLLADPDYLRNRLWRHSSVPYALVPALTEPPGPIVWDEYHQGFGSAPSLTAVVLAWLGRAPAGWVLLHLALVGIAGLLVAAVRFGPPRPGVLRARRSPLEHVDALAAGLQGAGGSGTAIELLIGGLRRRLSRAHASGGAPGPWLAALEPALPGRAREAAARLRAISSRPGGGERVLAAAHAVEDLWQELRPRRD